VRIACQRRAFAWLGSVCEKTEARARTPVNDTIVRSAEHTELRELRWLRLDVRTGIAEHERTRGRRQDRDDCRALDSSETAQHEDRCGQHRATVACRDDRITVTRFDLVDCDAHRRVGLLTECLAWMVVHRHDLGRRDDGHALVARTRTELGAKLRFVTDQRDLEIVLRADGAEGTCHFRNRRTIAAHCIDHDSHAARLAECAHE
jgi:hypothetical protein